MNPMLMHFMTFRKDDHFLSLSFLAKAAEAEKSTEIPQKSYTLLLPGSVSFHSICLSQLLEMIAKPPLLFMHG
jgi:hypothetical protein